MIDVNADVTALEDRKRRRRRAGRLMLVVALVCVAAALALGVVQLRAEGVSQFLYRAPGVGASTPAP